MNDDTSSSGGGLYTFDVVSANGYFEGADHDISWHNVDAEFDEFAVDQLDASEVLIFGRVTYELMASHWPTVTDDDPVAERMNAMEKIVVSTTLDSPDWNNTRVVQENVIAEIEDIKRQVEEDVAVLGSSKLAVSLLSADLVDEVRLLVNPIILGEGTPLFAGLPSRIELAHLSTRTFESGNVLLSYEPITSD